ncbi:hypothetical protein ACFVHW_04435 [Streptomyces sp. NPDC127110]|uniref:hypothetical protein n=1 Tax=Streptomyces sp. NPDC127110 TaxID=3345362 RepID=UPI003626BD4E
MNPNQLRVLEEDMGVDVVTFTNQHEGVTYLFVNPEQFYDQAVKGIARVCPELSLPQIHELVRTHCPNVIAMNERLSGSPEATPHPSLAGADTATSDLAPLESRRLTLPKWARIAAIAVPALVGGVIFAQALQPADRGAAASARPAEPFTGQEDAAASTFKNPDFQKIAAGGRLRCSPLGAYEAKCVDADGKVMFSEAAVGTSTAFTFSYDSQKIGFRIFPDENAAGAWSAEEGNRHLFQNVRWHGRVVLWGTDATRLEEWERSLADAAADVSKARHTALSAGRAPLAVNAHLPDRLTFLAFGTLGVTEESVQRALEADSVDSVQMLRAVDLVLGKGSATVLDICPAGANDPVAAVLDRSASGLTVQGAVSGAIRLQDARPTPAIRVSPGPTSPAPVPAARNTSAPPRTSESPAEKAVETGAVTGSATASPAEPKPSPTPDPALEKPAPLVEPTPTAASSAGASPETAPAPSGVKGPEGEELLPQLPRALVPPL